MTLRIKNNKVILCPIDTGYRLQSITHQAHWEASVCEEMHNGRGNRGLVTLPLQLAKRLDLRKVYLYLLTYQ